MPMTLHVEKSFEALEIDEARKLMLDALDNSRPLSSNNSPEVDLVERVLAGTRYSPGVLFSH